MKVTFLGTGTSHGIPMLGCGCKVCTSPDPRNRRMRPSVLLQHDKQIIIDTCPDFRTQLIRHPIKRLDAVLFTHWHADHILGLDDLRPFNYWQSGAIPIYGNAQTLERIRKVFAYIFDPIPYEGAPNVRTQLIEGPFDVDGLAVEPLQVFHGKSEILGFKIGDFAYITDASFIPETTLAQVRNIGCLVLNALRYQPHPTHFNLEQSIQHIEKIQPGRAFLTHIAHQLDHQEVENTLPAHVRIAYDGLALEL
ncbi:MAG: MBL fold metallo-hydrolase [Acidobacteria bacterium]|nr:MBL fold metallo-hydrolase [Acidobacteriota bacterium]